MKKLLSASAFLIFFNCVVLGQQTSESSKPAGTTSFYAELGGPGLVFSANLDKRFKNSHLGLGGRAGVGFASSYEETIRNGNSDYRDVSVVTFPLQLNYIFGKNESPHTFEVGAGVTIAGRKLEIFNFYDETRSSVFGTASFMYRRQPVAGGFTWRVGFTPIIAKGYIQPFAGVGVGYNF
ncbi:MAG TPA: hypothetical protein VEY06_04845 [Flavisolibacter sp.]|nr:hypothetical protein [Flavisolibacter sp.]